MEHKPVSNRMYALVTLYDWHTQFYLNAIDGISDEDALKRLDTKANHVAWIAGSALEERFEVAKLLGIEIEPSSHEFFANHKGIQEGVTYPSLTSYKADWEKISPLLREKLLTVTDEYLDKVIEYPEMSFPVYEMISFNTYREANCIGQIALWRRLLNYPPIKYM